MTRVIWCYWRIFCNTTCIATCITTRATTRANNTVGKQNEKLNRIVDFLMIHETMTGEQFADCMADREIQDATETSLFDAFKPEEKSEK